MNDAQLSAALRDLHGAMTDFPLSPRYALADVVLYGLAMDVLEQGEATRVVSLLKSPRPALTNARAAIESAVDVSFLVSLESEYAVRGCRARVFELLEIERMARRADVLPGTLPGASPQIERSIQGDVATLEERAPGRGRLLLGVYEELVKDPRRKHWSDHSREELYELIAVDGIAPADFAQQMSILYSALSMNAHPRARGGQRPTTMIAENNMLYRPDPSHADRAREVASIAVRLATRAVQRRRQFDA
jgi:hypothetical protein